MLRAGHWQARAGRLSRLSEVPARLATRLRTDELWLVVLAALVGVGAGLAVTAMSHAAQWLHELLFAIAPGARLSASGGAVPGWRRVAVPTLGGLAFAGLVVLVERWRPRAAVDPIEANALYGGRMSMKESLGVGAQTLLSTGVGASVGLEAGYTQIGAGLASKLGEKLRLRRHDVRLLVGCGAAGAIAAAFDAPLAAAFYAFELVIGSYAIVSLAPVVTSALAATLVARLAAAPMTGIVTATAATPAALDIALFVLLGIVAALGGILLMLGVTAVERLLRRLALPRFLRPALGGLIVGTIALAHPEVLSSGHGALYAELAGALPPTQILLILAGKAAAVAVSIGSGFRGGLFFASLVMGALGGDLFALGANHLRPDLALDPSTYAVIGMASLAVSVIGGPLTMMFLALEVTGDFALAPALTAAVAVAALTTRRVFGYSFATWRFHLRGEAIRGAHDIGWMRNLTVGRLMRRDVRTVRDDTTLRAFRRQFPLGSTQRVVAVDAAGGYAGILLVADAFNPELPEKAADEAIAGLLVQRGDALEPAANVRDAMLAFERTASEALAVVAAGPQRRVLGLLSEAHALRRYSEELERRRRELTGEI